MRIGALVHMYPPMHNAGAEHMLHAILAELVNRGHSAAVAISGPRADFKPYTHDGVRVGGRGLLAECDVILTHLDRTEEAERYCSSAGKPCVQIFHNHLRPAMAKLCDLAIYNSEWLARDFPVDAPSLVVPPPIWPERYRVQPGDRITLINLTAPKGARLFYALAEARPDLKFLGVRGAYGRQLEPPALSNLEVIDTCEDVRDVYARTRVLLVPSAYESYGRVAVEAMVSGIPVIATGTPGLHEAIDDGGVFPHEADELALGCEIEVPPAVLPAWSAALVNVLADWDACSARAAERAARFNPHADIDRLEVALRRLGEPQPDAVYVCRPGDNEELRYSLRSLANLPHRRVWVFGGCPEWARNVSHVSVPQDRTDAYANTTESLAAACRHPEVSDPFILMNDDFFVTEPVESVPLLNRGPVSDVVAADVARCNRKIGHVVGMETVAAFLAARGYPAPLSFELHMPMLVAKATMLEAIAICPDRGMHKRTVYGAIAGLTGDTVPDCKMFKVSEPLPCGPFVSSHPAVFHDALLPYLQRLFPQSGRYEKNGATMKVRVMKQFRDRTVARSRHVGELFDVSPGRVAELNGTKYGVLVEMVEPMAADAVSAPATIKDIKAILDKRGVEYRGNAKKDELLALL